MPRPLKGDDVSKLPGNHRLMAALSRIVSRCLRMPTGLTAGTRVVAALAAATIVVSAQTTLRFDRAGTTETSLVESLSAPMPAWHPVSVQRVAVPLRPPSRLPAHVDAALPVDAAVPLRQSFASHAFAIGASTQPGASTVARGYDATAPPALS
jgi:hypothetical protein